ncbi:hypothetical protein GCM10007148_21200 [Parvularcula lutaonensis]|nr:hypothetical protein GCM10007148_21200 [Parvularcula lutaonensis]
MAELLELARPAKGTIASFDCDGARLQATHYAEQLFTHHPPLEDRSAAPIGSVELEYVLRDVDPEDINGGHSSLQSLPTAESCRVGGRAVHPIKWKAKFGGMDVSDARKLKVLETENARLKKLLAEQMLDNTILKDLLGKN